ncbi:MAG TPA: hypothetical protein VMP01_15935 [Pirellulaceae bacterium]|nr:hypothetical protein [Pirellulaceae bacterium]
MRYLIACLFCVATMLAGASDTLAKQGKGGGGGGGRGGGHATRPSSGPKQQVKKEHVKKEHVKKEHVKKEHVKKEHVKKEHADKRLAKEDKRLAKDDRKPAKDQDKLAKKNAHKQRQAAEDNEIEGDEEVMDDDEVAHADHPGKGIGSHVRELTKQGVRGQELAEEIKRLQQEHGIAKGRFKDLAPDGGLDGTDGIDSPVDDGVEIDE